MLVLGIFYFIILLPMKRKQQKVQEFLDGLKVGDRVITTGGIYGQVTRLRRTACSCRSPTRSASRSPRRPSAAIRDRRRSSSPGARPSRRSRHVMNSALEAHHLLVVLVVFCAVGVYPIVAARYGIHSPAG